MRSVYLKIAFLIVMSVCALSAPVLASKNFEELTGADWKAMKQEEKEFFAYTAIGGLQRQGIYPQHKPSYYIETMDKILEMDDKLLSEYLDQLFVFCVHESDPHTQDKIEAIRDEVAKPEQA